MTHLSSRNYWQFLFFRVKACTEYFKGTVAWDGFFDHSIVYKIDYSTTNEELNHGRRDIISEPQENNIKIFRLSHKKIFLCVFSLRDKSCPNSVNIGTTWEKCKILSFYPGLVCNERKNHLKLHFFPLYITVLNSLFSIELIVPGKSKCWFLCVKLSAKK